MLRPPSSALVQKYPGVGRLRARCVQRESHQSPYPPLGSRHVPRHPNSTRAANAGSRASCTRVAAIRRLSGAVGAVGSRPRAPAGATEHVSKIEPAGPGEPVEAVNRPQKVSIHRQLRTDKRRAPRMPACRTHRGARALLALAAGARAGPPRAGEGLSSARSLRVRATIARTSARRSGATGTWRAARRRTRARTADRRSTPAPRRAAPAPRRRRRASRRCGRRSHQHQDPRRRRCRRRLSPLHVQRRDPCHSRRR